MIRFRLGQTWKREGATRPRDALALDVDGVNVLSGVNDEPLDQVVPDLVEAVVALSRGERFVQVSLPEAHFELVLSRAGLEVEMALVSMGRPSRWVRPPLRVDLEELVPAAARLGRSLLDDLSGPESGAKSGAARLRQMVRHLQGLERWAPHGSAFARPAPAAAGSGSPANAAEERLAPAGGPWTFGFRLDDAESHRSTKSPRSALAPLLMRGEVWLQTSDGTRLWRERGTPFLLVLELSRQADEIARALEVGEAELSLMLGGTAHPVTVQLSRAAFVLDGKVHPARPEELISAVYHLAIDFGATVGRLSRAQARNPYLQELVHRSKEGLSHLRGAIVAPTGSAQGARSRTPRREPALEVEGRLKRLKFEPRWEKTSLGGQTPGRLLLSARGPIFTSVEMACAFSASGELLSRHVSTHGVAASVDGHVLTATADYLYGFGRQEARARWMRDHDGTVIGPLLEHEDGRFVGLWQGSTVVAYSAVTGRELWRLAPPRTQRASFSLQGHRALVTTDAGYLYGLDLEDGQVRFRMRAAMPFVTPPVSWGKRFVSVMERGGQAAVVAADAEAGTIQWATEVELARPSDPLPRQGRVLIAGERAGKAHLVGLGAKGQKLWERALPLENGPFSLAACSRSVIVSNRRGAAVSVSFSGELEWRLGDAGEELPVTVACQFRRGVLLLPGEVVRAVDPHGGVVLAELKAGLGLCSLVADARLNLYLLDEDGVLRALRLASHLAVV